jgi:hypothetical protein
MRRPSSVLSAFLAVLLLTAPRCVPMAPQKAPLTNAQDEPEPRWLIEAEVLPSDFSLAPGVPATEIAMLFSFIDGDRIANNLTSLKQDARGTTAAQKYAKVMADADRAGHDITPGRDSRDLLEAEGIVPPFRGLSEIVGGFNSAAGMSSRLMSPGYLSIMRTAKWTHVAIGYSVNAANHGYWCLIFYIIQ